MATPEDDVLSLLDALKVLDKARAAAAGAVRHPNVQPITKLLDNGGLQTLMRDAPPTDSPLSTFLSHPANVAKARLIGDILRCLARLCHSAHVLALPQLFPFDVEFLVLVFSWIDFILPFGDASGLESLRPETRNFVRRGFAMHAFTFMDAFARLIPRDRLRSVILDSRQRATTVLVSAWTDWRSVYNFVSVAGGDESEGMEAHIGHCVALLPLYVEVVKDDEIASAIFTSDIRRALGRNPRRFYRRYAQYIRLLSLSLRYRDDEIFVPQVLRGVGTFLFLPGFGGPLITDHDLVETVFKSMTHNVGNKRPALWRAAWDVVAPMCLRNPRALAHLIAHGLFCSLVRIRMADSRTTLLAEVLHKLPTAVNSVSAVKGFHATHSSFKLIQPSLVYTGREQQVIDCFDNRWEVLRESERTWKNTYTCCNARCINGNNSDLTLLSCRCGEALYCSKACQRTHWIDGGHRRHCPSANIKKYGIMSATQVHRLVTETRAFVEHVYPSLQTGNEYAGLPLHMTMNPAEPSADVCVGLPSRMLTGLERLAIVVDYVFEHDGRKCVRRMYFVPEGWAGRINMSHRLLTQAFFKTDLANAPPKLPHLRMREALFGREP
ncbi:hypothetical protein HDZ31DRAFT_85383 [Schizophyllum fasciatum]